MRRICDQLTETTKSFVKSIQLVYTFFWKKSRKKYPPFLCIMSQHWRYYMQIPIAHPDFAEFPHSRNSALFYSSHHSNYPQRGEVAVFAGDICIFTGKWQVDFHSRIFMLADRRQQTISVRRAADNQLLFSVDPYPEVI